MLDNSFLPFICSISLTYFMNFLVSWLNVNFFACTAILISSVASFFLWMISLGMEPCHHMSKTNQNLQTSFQFFLVSEAFLFFSFFWGYFNFCWSQEYATSGFPSNVSLIDSFGVPMLNTTLLLTSSFYCTMSLHALQTYDYVSFFFGLFFSVYLSVLFTFFQSVEYVECSFSMMSSTFSSVFFLATSFHGAHVLIGTGFLIASLLRGIVSSFTASRTMSLLASIWYWHFVDVIWIFLYLIFYASYYPLFNE